MAVPSLSTLIGYLAFSVPFAIVLVFRIGTSIFKPAVSLFLYDAICERLYSSDNATGNSSTVSPLAICNNLTEQAQDVVQKDASNYLVALKFIQSILTFATGLFFGGWMDRVGRRLPMILSCLGGIAAMIGYAAIRINAEAVVAEILIVMAVYAIIGPHNRIPAAIESYIAAKTQSEDRTNQLGLSMACTFSGLLVGSFILAVMVDRVPYWAIFLCIGFFYAVSLLMIAVTLPESPSDYLTPGADFSGEEAGGNDEAVTLKQKDNSSMYNKASSFYRMDNFRDTLRTLTQERPENMRRCLLIALLCFAIMHLASEIDLMMFYVRHDPLNWSQSDYGYVLSFQYALNGFMLVFVLPILLNRLHLSDSAVIAVCGVLKAIGLGILGFSDRTWLIYAANVLTSTYGLISSCLRSLVSKLVGDDESGRCFSIIASVEIISDPIGTLIFTRLYYMGLSLENPYGKSIPFFVMSLCHLILAALALTIYYGRRRVSEVNADGYTSFSEKQNKAYDDDDEGSVLEVVNGRN